MKWILARLSGKPVYPRLPLVAETDLAMCIHDRAVHPLPALTDLEAGEAKDVLEAADYQRVCIVRNPYTRLVSAWADKIRFREPGFEEACTQVLNHAGRHDAEDVPSFREFATWVLDTQDPSQCHDHWQDQTALNFTDLIDYYHIIRLESFQHDLQLLFDRIEHDPPLEAATQLRTHTQNVGIPVRWSQTYDEALAARVAGFYAPTFDAFGYDRDSWKELVAKPDPAPEVLEAAALKIIRRRNAVIESWNRSTPPFKRLWGLVSSLTGPR